MILEDFLMLKLNYLDKLIESKSDVELLIFFTAEKLNIII